MASSRWVVIGRGYGCVSGIVSHHSFDIFDTVDVWHHFYIQLEADNTVNIYIDGVLDTTGTYSGDFASSNGFYPDSGFSNRVSDATCRPFNFAFANVATYDTDVYTAQHVSDVMTAFGI